MASTQVIFQFLAGLSLVSLVGFSVLSYFEKEKRAATISLFGALFASGIFLAVSFLPETIRSLLVYAGGASLLLLVAAFFLPTGGVERANETPGKRFDERDIMFARANLRVGSEDYRSYYKMRPENQGVDDETRKLPGLCSPTSAFADPLLFTSPDASFFLTGALRDAVDGPVGGQKITLPPGRMEHYITALAKFYGALDTGFTPLEPYHVYTHIGRGTGEYGAPIAVEHQNAIAFTVEMDHDMIGANPLPPGLMESARQYVESARAAVQLAAAIRGMGYPARAHIDGNYRVIAPLVARDAGLGEIGRMGLLITPRKGPRVRLGVVTTDLPLQASGRKQSMAVLDFCRICKKCADCCPSRAIPFDARQEIDGALRWKINSESCFRYWNTVGTDCGRCMTVCPFSHADNAAHNVVRWGVNQSGLFRRAVFQMDGLLYGRKPALRKAPDWTNIWKESPH